MDALHQRDGRPSYTVSGIGAHRMM
jgi:hypothetical protein